MFKRLFWMTAGAAGAVWAQRRLREKVERYTPDKVADQVAGTVRALGRDLRSATEGGRAAMREREESLRAQFRPPAR